MNTASGTRILRSSRTRGTTSQGAASSFQASTHKNASNGGRHRKTVSAVADEDIELSENEGNTTDDSADDDWGRKRKTKRARNLKQRKGVNSGAITLNLLPTMPLDILFEIMSHLAPRDLLNICLISKGFYSMLSDKNGISIWKTLRGQYGAPDPPPGFSEYRWSRLLFGSPRCGVCDTNGVHTIEFGLRRRACHSCIKRNVVSEKQFSQVLEFLEKDILDLVPYSNSRNLPFKRSYRRRFYWVKEIESISEELGRYQSDISLRKPGAKQRMNAFIEHRKQIVKQTREMIPTAEEWLEKMRQEKYINSNELIAKRQDEIKKRFLELDHTEVDIARIMGREEARRPTSLNTTSWNLVRAPLEAAIWRARILRLQLSHATLIEARKTIFATVYTSHAASKSPSETIYLPSLKSCYELEGIKHVIYSHPEVDITPQSFEKPMEAFPGFIEQVRDIKMTKLLGIVASNLAGVGFFLKVEPPPIIPRLTGEQLLTLACITLGCSSYGCIDRGPFHGIEEAFRHDCQYPCPPHFLIGYTSADSTSAAGVIKAAGLDFLSATSEDMDALNPQFVCTDCMQGRVFHWREAVRHASYNRSGHRSANTFRLCTERELAKPLEVVTIWGREIVPGNDWSCNHCNIHCGDYKLETEVIEHVKDVHGVVDPKIKQDFILKPGKQYHSVVPHRRIPEGQE